MTTGNPIDRMVVKIPTGIEPIDRVLGGFERGRCHYLFGEQPAGRGVAAVHFMIRGLQNKERVVFITRSSGPEVVERMSQMGYDYSTDVRTEQFIILEYTDEIVEQIQSLADFDAVIRELEALLSQRKPARLVLDPIAYLFVSKSGGSAAGKIRKFIDWLNAFGTTTLIAGGDDDTDDVVGTLHECCGTVLRVNRKTFGTQEASVLTFVKTSAGIQLPEEAFVIDSERGIVPIVMRPPVPAPPPVAESRPLPPMPPPPPPVSAPLVTQQAPAAAAQSASANTQTFPWQTPPRAAGQPAAVPPAAAQPSSPSILSPAAQDVVHEERFKVLVIDDDPATCNLISMALKDDCFVKAVHDGPSGLNALKDDTYDLVLLDVNLPIVDGFHVCQHIRKTHWQVPIIIITGTHLRAEDRLQSASVGGDLYLTKPFSVQELRLRVRQLIGRYREVPEWIGAGAAAGIEPVQPPPGGGRMQQVVPLEEFIRHLDHERRNSKVIGMPFSVVSCRLQSDSSAEAEERMRDMIRSQMRENDVMTIDHDQRSLIILPEASAEGAQIFIQRVRQIAMTEVGLDPLFQWRTYPTDGENFEQLLMRVPESRRAAPPPPASPYQRVEETTEIQAPPQVFQPKPAETEATTQIQPPPIAAPPQITEPITQAQAPPIAAALPPPPPAAPAREEVTAQYQTPPVTPPSPPPPAEQPRWSAPEIPPAELGAPAHEAQQTAAAREGLAGLESALDLKSLVKEIFHEELREFVREAVRESMRLGTQQRVTPGDIRQMLRSTLREGQRETIPATKRQLPQPELSSAPAAISGAAEAQPSPSQTAVPSPALATPPPAPVPEPPPAVIAPPAPQAAESAPSQQPPSPAPEAPVPKPAKPDLRWSFIDFTQRR